VIVRRHEPYSRLVLASLAFGTTVALPAKLVTKPVAYEHGGVKLEGWLAYDDEKVAAAKPAPGVLVLPEWWGLTEYPKAAPSSSRSWVTWPSPPTCMAPG
jgi:hypothetical protein